MPLFRSSPKNPQELVKALRDTLQVLSATEGSSRKAEKVRLLSQNSIPPFTLSSPNPLHDINLSGSR